MGTLGDSFEDKYKNEFAERQIKVKSVIKAFVSDTNPPKEKRIIIIGIDNTEKYVGVILFNTAINWKAISTIELAKLQYYLTKEDNPEILQWDSYIDCSDLFEFTKEELVESLIRNPENVLGEIKQEDFEEVIKLVKISPKITTKKLKKYNLS